MYYRLREDKHSHCKTSVIYGYANEVVKQISRSDHVLIVEGALGRFSISINQLTEMSDLEKFKHLFDRDRVKVYAGKLEYRVSDLDANLQEARDLITKHKLSLVAGTSGDMASYGAFEVSELV